jgi:hypothetical protein
MKIHNAGMARSLLVRPSKKKKDQRGQEETDECGFVTFMSSSILATCDWMVPTISLSGDIVGYLPSSHTNLQLVENRKRAIERRKHWTEQHS